VVERRVAWKRLTLTEPETWASKFGEDSRKRIRATGEEVDGGFVYIVGSFTSPAKEYTIFLRYAPEGWSGTCNCRGFSGRKKEEQPEPCAHLKLGIFAHPDFVAFIAGRMGITPEERGVALEIQKVAAHSEKAAAASAAGAAVGIATARKVFWASAIPLIEKCAGAAGYDGIVVESAFDDSGPVGQAVHTASAQIVRGQTPDVAAICTMHAVSDHADDVADLVRSANRAWNGKPDKPGIKRFFQDDVHAEERLSFVLTAPDPYQDQQPTLLEFVVRADVWGVVVKEGGKKRVTVVDWKTSRDTTDADATASQLKAAAFGIAAKDKDIEEAQTIIVWLREGTISAMTYQRAELRAWMAEFVKRSAFWNGKKYRQGGHCRYCPRLLNCEGRREWFRSGVQALTIWEGGQRPELLADGSGAIRSPEVVIGFYERVKEIQALAKAVLDQLKQEIEARGPIPHPDRPGYALDVVLRNKRVIEVSKALPYLNEVLGAESVTALLTLGNDALKDAVMERAAKGHKTEAWQQLQGVLTDAGVYTEQSYKVMELVRQGGNGNGEK
jgi:hypothetical protein